MTNKKKAESNSKSKAKSQSKKNTLTEARERQYLTPLMEALGKLRVLMDAEKTGVAVSPTLMELRKQSVFTAMYEYILHYSIRSRQCQSIADEIYAYDNDVLEEVSAHALCRLRNSVEVLATLDENGVGGYIRKTVTNTMIDYRRKYSTIMKHERPGVDDMNEDGTPKYQYTDGYDLEETVEKRFYAVQALHTVAEELNVMETLAFLSSAVLGSKMSEIAQEIMDSDVVSVLESILHEACDTYGVDISLFDVLLEKANRRYRSGTAKGYTLDSLSHVLSNNKLSAKRKLQAALAPINA